MNTALLTASLLNLLVLLGALLPTVFAVHTVWLASYPQSFSKPKGMRFVCKLILLKFRTFFRLRELKDEELLQYKRYSNVADNTTASVLLEITTILSALLAAASIMNDDVANQYAPMALFLSSAVGVLAAQLIFHNKERRIYDGKEHPGVLLDNANDLVRTDEIGRNSSHAAGEGKIGVKSIRDVALSDLEDLSDDPTLSFADILRRDRERVLESVKVSKFKTMIEVTDYSEPDSKLQQGARAGPCAGFDDCRCIPWHNLASGAGDRYGPLHIRNQTDTAIQVDGSGYLLLPGWFAAREALGRGL